MKYERRMFSRIVCPMSVELFNAEKNPVTVRLRDLSMGGALLDPDGVALEADAPIELLASFPYHGRSRRHRLGARILGRDQRGVAVRFERYDNWAYTAMADWLYTR